jgi:hypothetical protein
MDLTGLVLEMLLPGILILFSAGLLIWEMGLLDLKNIVGIQGGLLVTGFLSFSYIIGVAVRHTFFLKSSAYHYRLRIQQLWPRLAMKLVEVLRSRIPVLDCSEEGQSRLPGSGTALKDFSDEQIHELVQYLRDMFLSKCEDSFGDYLMYQWRVARLARNCHLPLILCCSACFLSGIHRLVAQGITLSWSFFIRAINSSWPFFAGAAVCGALAFRMVTVFKERLYWHVDILMRVGAVTLFHQKGIKQTEAPVHLRGYKSDPQKAEQMNSGSSVSPRGSDESLS